MINSDVKGNPLQHNRLYLVSLQNEPTMDAVACYNGKRQCFDCLFTGNQTDIGGEDFGKETATRIVLTKAQATIVKRLGRLPGAVKAGTIRCSANQRKAIEVLEKYNLVTSAVEVQPDAGRGRHRLVYTVSIKP